MLLVFYASLVTYRIPLPAAEDLPRQMKNGEMILHGDFRPLTQNLYSYTQPDHYFANHHWLYGVFAYVLHAAVGWSGMVIFKIIFILLTFVILFRAALRRADFWLVSLASIPAILLIAGRADLRPELFGYFFTALYIYVLLGLDERPKSKAVFWLIPMQILWANSHITFPIGVMIIGGFLVEKIILDYKNLRNNPVIKKLIVLLVVLAVVSFINPLGIQGVIYSLTANIGSKSPLVSSEVQPISSTINDLPKYASISLALVTPAIVLLALSFIVGFRQKQVMYFFASAGSAALAYYVLRGSPFLGIFFLLAFPANLNGWFVRVGDWIGRKWSIPKIRLETILGLVMCIGLLGFMLLNYSTFLSSRNIGIGLGRNSEDMARFFIDQGLKGPIFNDTDIGSYLIYYLYPKERVYADNRFGDAYSDEFFSNDYIAAITDEKKWHETLDKYKFNTMVLYQYDNGYSFRDFIYRRLRDPEWAFVYGNRYSVILVRNTPENQEVIDTYAITTENAQERFSSLTKTLDPDNLVAAADLFALMGQHGWALAHYELALSQRPEWAKIWFVMGQMELQKGDQKNSNPALAALFLEQGIARGWKTANSYSFLALAYFRMEQIGKAKQAVEKELKINPKSDDAETWRNNFIKYDAEHLK